MSLLGLFPAGVGQPAGQLFGRVRGGPVGRAALPFRHHQLRRPHHRRLGQARAHRVHQPVLLGGGLRHSLLPVSELLG